MGRSGPRFVRLAVAGLGSITLAGCLSGPAGGERTISVYSPYAGASQPSAIAVAIDPVAAQSSIQNSGAKTPVIPPPPPPPDVTYPSGYVHLPEPPRSRWLHGPTTVCQSDFAVELASGALASASDASIVVYPSQKDYDQDISLFSLSYSMNGWDDVGNTATIVVPGLGTIHRRSAIRRGNSETAYIAHFGWGMPRDWVIASRRFDGSAADERILRLIRTRTSTQLRPDPCFPQ